MVAQQDEALRVGGYGRLNISKVATSSITKLWFISKLIHVV